MLAHFQEEEAFGRARGVLGDETIIIITLNTITSVTLRTQFFSLLSFYSLLCGACLLGLRYILSFFCNFCLIQIRSFLVLYLVYTSLGFHCLCVIFIPSFFPFLLSSSSAVGFSVFISCGFVSSLPATPHFYIPLQILTAITHLMFFLLLYCLYSVFLVCLFLLALANMGRVYSLILQHGKWSEQEVSGDFKAGNGHFVYLRISRVFVFSNQFFFMAF